MKQTKTQIIFCVLIELLTWISRIYRRYLSTDKRTLTIYNSKKMFIRCRLQHQGYAGQRTNRIGISIIIAIFERIFGLQIRFTLAFRGAWYQLIFQMHLIVLSLENELEELLVFWKISNNIDQKLKAFGRDVTNEVAQRLCHIGIYLMVQYGRVYNKGCSILTCIPQKA